MNMNHIIQHLRRNVFRGLLAVIPIGLSVLAIQFLYVFIDRKVMGLAADKIGYTFPGLGILLVLVLLYFLGIAARNVVGREIFKTIEQVTRRIPIIKTTYEIGKQLSTTLALPEKQVFKRVVLVPFLKANIWTVGFVTGVIADRRNGDELLKVYVPTPPNPTSGTIVLIRESDTRDPGWSIEEAMKTVISGGIIGPLEIA